MRNSNYEQYKTAVTHVAQKQYIHIFFASTKESNSCIVLHEYRQYFAQQLLKDIKPLLYISIIILV